MDVLIKSFIRVQRGIDDGEDLIARFPELESQALLADGSDGGVSAISAADRLRLLDLPEPEELAANLARSSELGREDLLRRAATTPEELSTSEIEVLRTRYWLAPSSAESGALARAYKALQDVSLDHCRETKGRLQRVRAALYAEHEESALDNGTAELIRRMKADLLQSQTRDVETALAATHPWVRRLWDESLKWDKETQWQPQNKVWGYVMFYDPAVCGGDDRAFEDFLSRRDAVLKWATHALRCGMTIDSMWRLDKLDWPVGEEEGEEREEQSGSSSSAFPPFDRLRKRFTEIRDRVPQRQRTTDQNTGAAIGKGGLPEVILNNVFLVTDRPSVDSVLSKDSSVDDMWVWAVDPDYDLETADKSEKYQGFLRVRLQQIVHHFFKARRWQEDELPMRVLWEAAQKSKNSAFVSEKEEEVGRWKRSRDVGSLLKVGEDAP